MGRKFDLVIFDCDGVLVDSERITNTVFAQMLNELGLKVDLAYMYNQFVGHSTATCIALIETLLGRPIPVGFLEELGQRTHRALEAKLTVVEGIEDVLQTLRIPFCVASNGDHSKMRKTLGITGLLPQFETKLFSASDVAQGKPFPDVYLLAASSNGVAPSRCAVIEDTPIGVQAGVAAGMTVFGYSKLMAATRLREAGATTTFDAMVQLPALLGES